MKTTNEEFKLDWYNTRGGRTIIKNPRGFGDEITLAEIVRGVGLHGRKGAPVKGSVKKVKKNQFKELIQQGYNCTIISVPVTGEVYTIKRLLADNQITKIIGHNGYIVEYVRMKLDI